MDSLHMLWYKSQIEKDREEQRAEHIAIAEYLAGFLNPKAVAHVRNARENTKKVTDESLIKSLQRISGLSREKVLNNIRTPKPG
jgi:hypothetical protein